MFALLILPILVSGFIIISINPFYRIKLYRYNGQLLYLKVAYIGVVCFIIVSMVSFFLKDFIFDFTLFSYHFYFDPSLVTHISKKLTLLQNEIKVKSDIIVSSWLLALSFLTILISIIYSYVVKAYVYALRALSRSIYNNDTVSIVLLGRVLKDSPIDNIFYESLIYQKHILVSLSNRKVYIGIINKLEEPSESEEPNQEISLVPAISGYRDKDTLKVVLQNEYSNLPMDSDSSIIIKVDEIETVSWFNHTVYDSVNDNMQLKDTIEENPVSEQCTECKKRTKIKVGSFCLVKD